MKEKRMTYWLFVLPVIIPYVIFFLIPILMSLFYSMLDWNGISKTGEFVGLKNYLELLSDKNYLNSIWFSIKFVFCSVILSNVLALLLALWVNKKRVSSNIMRTSFFMPNVICSIVVGFLWIFIFNQVSASVFDATGIGIFGISWLSDPTYAFVSILLVSVWQGAGYYMVIYLSGLNSINTTYMEAASIDGASPFQRFFRITLPLLMPSVTVNLFMATANAFKLFDLNLALTKGGPGRATTAMALDVYTETFTNNRMGYGSAKAIILFLIVMVITLLQTRYTKSREVEV